MKKLFVFLILVMSVLMLKAGGEATGYVKVGDETYFCEKVRPGLFNMNLTLDDGTIIKVPLKKVDSYSSNGRMFERLPVMCKGAPENCTELMEYVTSRNGFRLYKYSTFEEHGELYDNTYKKAHQEFEYLFLKMESFACRLPRKTLNLYYLSLVYRLSENQAGQCNGPVNNKRTEQVSYNNRRSKLTSCLVLCLTQNFNGI